MIFLSPRPPFPLPFPDNIFIQNIADDAGVAELQINPTDRMMHMRIPEGDVSHTRGNGADCKADATRLNTLNEDIRRVILHTETVILIPNGAIMNPNVSPSLNVETVCVEGSQVQQ